MKLTTAQIAQIAYAACNEASVIMSCSRSPEWKSLNDGRRGQMLQYVNDVVDADPKGVEIALPPQIRDGDGPLRELCTQIVDALAKALV